MLTKRLVISDSTWGWEPEIYFLICVSFLFYGLALWLNYCIIGVSIVFFAIMAKKKCIAPVYFLVVFFEQVLVLPFGGSFFVLYELVFGVYILLTRGTIVFNKKFLVVVIYFGFSLLYSMKFKDSVSVLINMGIVYLICTEMEENSENRHLALYSLGIAAVFSGLYGFVHMSGMAMEYGVRYSGTVSDSNYSSLFYIMGIVAVMGTKRMGKIVRIVSLSILAVSLMRTISLTGILVGLCMVWLYVTIRRPNIGIMVGIGLVFCFVVVMLIDFPRDFFAYGIQVRIRERFEAMLIGDWSTVTTFRSDNAKMYMEAFWNEITSLQRVFGGVNTITGEFSNMMVARVGYLSHNSYIDMLFMVGITGTTLIVGYGYGTILHYFHEYRRTEDTSYLGLALVKLTILIIAFTICIFPYKYFNLGLIL